MRMQIAGGLAVALLWCAAAPRSLGQDQAQHPQAGQGQAQIPQVGQTVIGTGEATFDPNQPIRAGFTVSIAVSSKVGPEPDLTGVFPVDASGAVLLKLVGRVELRGLTPLAASERVAGMLKGFLNEPKASVAIIAVPRPVVFISGGIFRPGAVIINDGMTLSEVLTIIGYPDTSDLGHVRVVHKDEKGVRTTKEYDFTRWVKPAPGAAPDESQNPVLADKDLIYVPNKGALTSGLVSVEGDVAKPGQVAVRYGVPTRLREVISMAGGLNPTADIKEINIRRLGVEKPITVQYEKMEAGDLRHDIEVKPDDIIYVQKLAYDQFINMNGGFVRVGKLPLMRQMTLTQAISEAGGLVLNVKEKEGRIFRHSAGADPTKTQIIAFNYKKVRENKEPDVSLMPGDTVEIPLKNPPAPAMNALQITQSLTSIALVIERLGSSRGFGF
jgi:protein involved in polysaccharide export with SLBB domain